MATIRTNDGVSLHVTDRSPEPTGGGAQPITVVLVAGYMAPSTSWHWQQQALLPAGFRVVAVDRRSHGASEAPSHGQRIARHAKDLDQVLTQMDLGDVLLVGASMGASVIWSYIDLFGTSGVAGIVSVDQTPRMLNDDDWQHGFYGFDRSNAGTFFREGVPETGRGAGIERTMEAIGRLMTELGGATPVEPIKPETLPLLQDHAFQDWRDVIRRTDVPVLFVAGDESQFWPAEHAGASAAIAPRGAAVVLADCGHATPLDQPEALNTVLIDFAKGLGR